MKRPNTNARTVHTTPMRTGREAAVLVFGIKKRITKSEVRR